MSSIGTLREALLEGFARRVVYPAADLKNGSRRLAEAAHLRRSQWWTRPQLDEYRNARLASLLEHARTTVPFYRTHWGDAELPAGVSDLARLPTVRKSHIRSDGSRMISTAYASDELLTAKTGGSTGTALTLRFDFECQQARNAAAIRADEWAGWRLGAKVGALWGNPPVAVGVRARLRALLHERTVYCDTMTLSDRVIEHFVESLRSDHVTFLFGHAHSLFRFCESVERQNLPVPPIRGVVSTSMMLLRPERELIERVLSCPVTDRYGCEEVGLIASECERHSGYHVNEEHVVVELVDEQGRPVPAGQPGLVCVTDLNNRAMPLVRYVVEDMAVASTGDCACGRVHRRLERIVGRTADFLKRKDGSLVAGVSLVERTLTDIPGIAQMQLVQESRDVIRVNLVPGSDFDHAAQGLLVAELERSMGPGVAADVRLMDSLPQEANGKYRFSICRV